MKLCLFLKYVFAWHTTDHKKCRVRISSIIGGDTYIYAKHGFPPLFNVFDDFRILQRELLVPSVGGDDSNGPFTPKIILLPTVRSDCKQEAKGLKADSRLYHT